MTVFFFFTVSHKGSISLPLRLYAVIAIILLRQQPFLQRICSIISAFPKSLILRVSAVLNCT